MPSTPPPTQWIVFFPLDHFHLRDEPDMLNTPLFGDATLVSYETLLRGFPNMTYIKAAGAYLAVWRSGVVNMQWFQEDRKNEVFLADARRRASQVAALLSIAFLAMHTEGYLTGLTSQFFDTQEHFAILGFPLDGRGLISSSSGPHLTTFTRCEPELLSFSRTELQIFLNQPLVQNLVHSVSTRKSNFSQSLRQSIVQSCLRLATACHETSYTAQLLGAITSIEILLTGEDQGTSFDLKERRLGILLGQEFLQKYEFKQVLQARHVYVHRGEEQTTRQRALMAIGVALYALLIYTITAQDFDNKNTLLTYLDAVYLNDKLTKSGLNLGTQLISKHLEQVRLNHKLPFLEYVDKTLVFDKEYDAGLYDRFDRVFIDDEKMDGEASTE